MTMTITVLRCDGRTEQFGASRTGYIDTIKRQIDAQTIDAINLRDGRIMFVDDFGWETETVESEVDGKRYVVLQPVRARKPINPEATKLYHAICRPGVTHQIVGDVAIITEDEAERGA